MRGRIGCCGRRPFVNTSRGSGTLGLARCVFAWPWPPHLNGRVTISMLSTWLQMLPQGVARQVAAFTIAMRQVLPLSKLLVFTTAELLESVCGEAVHWDEPTVRDCIVRNFRSARRPLLHFCVYSTGSTTDAPGCLGRSRARATRALICRTSGSSTRWCQWARLRGRTS